ncbi:MarR family winged helix-turn-helix transcriptional regulator [Thalassovita mediterranea]|jgi:DNA-binding MarR family transcriptional regulator|uniref:Homoprotocatechuate degradation operon regulator, HpaR n=1 Tax=Thalassovita mediterranea TaxID=340021 RepID=A0A0P1GR58_9RHOB|nr:MarR family transcriptional regulator [Thalassovita mediterranea]MCG7575090.1 MarR family transcriptional regulator [Phaeobacter sp. CNT1-3]CUH85004.1 homoprotocatechuate degradation operon regulator, HpaR [Thalassovita mediterranea]SIS35331.1 transcriptional regulator, MarR family [Thalassovita mediterranea]
MGCEQIPSYDPTEDQTLSPEIRALLGVDAIYNQVLAVVEQMSFAKDLPDPAKRLVIRLDAPMRLGDLARVSNVLPSTLTALVDLLEAEGLAERKRDPSDRRAWLLTLTEKGHARRAEMAQKAAEVFHAITGFDAAETAAFADLTDKARRNLHETLSNRSRK